MQAPPQLMGSDLGNPPHGKDSAFATDTNQKAIWETDDISAGILAIIFDYALDKFDDSRERLASGMINFLSIINSFVMAEKPVDMCLPGFPFKSANKIHKVLGFLPDKAEELALQRLDTMCLRYPLRHANFADLSFFTDLLCIPDRDTWAYGEALRALAVKKGFNQITFSRLKDLAGLELPEKMSEIVYVANATNFRRYLLNKYGKDDYDINYEIATNPDTLMTYCGYKRFLESDLQHIFPTGENRSHNGYRRDVKYLAKEMMIRGCAFAGAIKAAFPNHLRLSIHQSTGEHKVSLSLLPTKTGYTTPWHCCVALMGNGEWLSAPMIDFQNDPCFDVVYEDGRPSYFREKTCRDEDRK
ncbi:transferase family [Fusarium mexicanum]|uniref:Transferase family n=1 Tax=Fusarium mexicanum TaxID=751941 RepID=A0A8H5IM97_9HYPO|nr:transferase family [Fusarium mexicanum]